MKISKIMELIKKGESQEIEFKSKVDGLGKTLCAFLNTNNGIVLIGISEEGKIVGISKKDVEKIENIIDAIYPKVKLKVDLVKIDNKTVAVILVKKSERLHTYGNIAYVRVGTSERALGIDELYERAGEALLIKFDEITNDLASVKDIDFELVKKYLEERERVRKVKRPPVTSKKKIFEMLRITVRGKVTNGGILFFSKNPQKYFPHATIRIVELISLEERKIVDEKTVSGSSWEMFEKAYEEVMRKLRKFVKIVGKRRVEEYEIPEEIVREALANAICHRNYFDSREIIVFIYPDRVEFINPGSFPPGTSPENPVHKPRNPLLAQYFYDVGIIEKYGSGIYAMKRLARERGLELFYRLEENTTKLTVKRRLPEFYDEISSKILSLLLQRPMKSSELSEALSVSEDTVLRRLKRLMKKGLVRRVGKGRSTFYELHSASFPR